MDQVPGRIGRVKCKNGGADLTIHPCCNDTTLTISYEWGEVIFRQYNDKRPIDRRDALYMLRAAEDSILRGDVK